MNTDKLEVKIEIRSIVKKKPSQSAYGNTHNFTVLVRGHNDNKIEHFVKQVVFHLPFNSSDSKQVRQNPPYLISGSTHASFRLPIDIFFHTSGERNQVRYSYYVFLPNMPVENAVNVKSLKFLNTPLDFRQKLLLGGAEQINQSNSETVVTQIKSEPVDITENQNGSLENSVNAEFEVGATKGANIQNELSDTCVKNEDISEPNGPLLIQDIYSFDDLKKENEDLKKENETLLQNFTTQEEKLTTYIEKLPVLQNDSSAVDTELSQLQIKSEDLDAKISSLQSTIQTLMSEMLLQTKKVDEVKVKRKKTRKAAMVAQGK